MTKKLISFDDTKPALGLPDPLEERIAAGYAKKTHVTVGASGADYATILDALADHPAGNVEIELQAGTTLQPTLPPIVGVKNVTIKGQGRGATIVEVDGPFIEASGDSDAWEIHNLTIQHTSGENTDDAISVDYPRRWSVRHCEIYGFGGSSIRYAGGLHSEIAFNYIIAKDSTSSNGMAGVHITPSAESHVPTTITTRQNYVASGIQHGFLFDRTNVGCLTIGDIAEACAIGFKFQLATRHAVISPYTEGNTVGIEMHDTSAPIIGSIRDEPVRTWSATGFFERRTARVGGGWMSPGKGLVYSGASNDPNFDTEPSLRWDTSNPNGRLTAPVGSVTLRPDGSAGATLYIKESGTGNVGWVPVGQQNASSEQLQTAANAINISGKQVGTMVFNRTANRPVWSTGPAATDAWVWADGTTAFTPV